MKPTPKGWPRLSTSLYYDEAGKAIDWICEAFGFEVRLKVQGDDGRIHHSELTYGDDALIMIGQSGRREDRATWPEPKSPRSIGGANTQSVMVFVDDADRHCERARAAGATIIDEPKVHDYGEDYWSDRSYGAVDIEGHMWWFTQRIRDPKAS